MAEAIVQWLAGELADGFARTLEAMTEQRPRISFEEAEAPSAGQLFWWEQTLNIDSVPSIWIGAPQQAWMELGSRALRSAGIDTIEAGEARDTYVEILSQILSGLAQAAGSRIEREVLCAKGGEAPAAPSLDGWLCLEVSYPEGALPGIFAGFSAELLRTLGSAESAAERIPAVAEPDVPRPPEPPASKTLDLLLEVELPVSISFGRAELALRDVLKLTSGSIIELNRSISEPVEVIVNNCVVARGEVVVIDGNYGVKIHRIVSPQERLRTLR